MISVNDLNRGPFSGKNSNRDRTGEKSSWTKLTEGYTLTRSDSLRSESLEINSRRISSLKRCAQDFQIRILDVDKFNASKALQVSFMQAFPALNESSN